MFQPVSSKLDFPSHEHEILELWERNRTFYKLMEKNRGRPKWSFIDGPITANNPMGVHHAWGRTYKDIYQRYRAMKGFDQRFQNGFDSQGLWVEVEVEKELGLNSKREIEAYGLENFSRKCKERVLYYSDIQTRQSIRLGQWMDWPQSYYTMSDENEEHIWHFLKACHQRGWLYQGHQTMPWCIRCGTSLSQHEMLDSYRDITHLSIYLKLPIAGREGEYFLVWTTTPWTLTSNTALAVHPDLDYVKIRQGSEFYYLSRGTLPSAIRGDYEIVSTLKGRDLVGLRYKGPFDELPAQAGVEHMVVPWDQVGEEEGTGIVHIAPGCGQEDFELGKTHGLKVIAPLSEDGIFLDGFGALTGTNVRDSAPRVAESLKSKGYLYRTQEYTHRYPVCWRCGEELVFRLVDEWFISVDEIRPKLIEAARTVEWIPGYALKRMEDWLNNMRDWVISRRRYWGLPLPFYPCKSCGELTVIGSRKELQELAISGLDQLVELHRPWIDNVVIACPRCGGAVQRIPEVGDCWLDAGIVPYSTLSYLYDRAYWQQWFPADFIVEMREQIRLWFYSMLFMSVTLEGVAPYRCAMVYEKVYDEFGRPMHKSLGNAIWFDEAAERMGADVMRWMYASQNIQQNLLFGWGPAEEVKRKLLVLWNAYSFFVTYANLDKVNPRAYELAISERPLLDRWIIARLHQVVRSANLEMDRFNVAAVTRDVERFIDDLSNWYIRRSRRRFWKSENDTDKASAYKTLYEVLTTLIATLAPIMPFLTERMYQNLVRSVEPTAPESIHLLDYPQADQTLIDEPLIDAMDKTMRIVALGRAARNKAKVKVRQPLRELLIWTEDPSVSQVVEPFIGLIQEELNVKAVRFVEREDEIINYSIAPNHEVLAPKLGPKYEGVKQAIASLDPFDAAKKLRRHEPLRVSWEGEVLELEPEELMLEVRSVPGYAAASEYGFAVALDLTLTEQLRREGLARELVRHVQQARKAAGLNIDDRIVLYIKGEGLLQDAVEAAKEYIASETLAVQLLASDPPSDAFVSTVRVDGQEVRLALKRV
jgi:isoleucyl-tRNA synthetase